MIFVTGGTGLVGNHLLYALTVRGRKVRALYRNEHTRESVKKVFGYYSGQAEELYRQIEWVKGELTDLRDVPGFLDDVEELYHCAAMVSFSSRDKKSMLRNNIEGTACVVNACLQRKTIRLCHVSSIAALGASAEGEPVEESHLWKPSEKRSAYSKSKFHSEMEVWRGITEGMEAVIVNPSVILGPGNWEKGSASFFPALHKGLNFYTLGVTGYVDVRDVVECMILLMEKKITGERFILNSENLSYREFFGLMARAFGKKEPQFKVTPLAGWLAVAGTALGSLFTRKSPAITRETLRSANEITYYSNRKISEVLGFSFRPVASSIDAFAGFYLDDLAGRGKK